MDFESVPLNDGERPVAGALDIAHGFLDALTSQDFDQLAQYLADDFSFEGPIARYQSAAEFLAGARAFARALRGGWHIIAEFGDASKALLLYDLPLISGAALRVADFITVRNGKIQTEVILFDTQALR